MTYKPLLQDDIVAGAREIAKYLYGDDAPENVRAAYYRATSKQIETFKFGGTLCARKSDLDAWLRLKRAAR